MPSTLLDARQITRRHGARTVLDAVDLRVDARSRIAVVGPNGSGKSTLLRILAGAEAPDAGTVARRGSVGYLPQLAGAGTVRETILEQVGVSAAVRAVERLERLRALIARAAGAVVLVSHDRALLADVADTVVELDARTGKAARHARGWDVFEPEREVRRRAAASMAGARRQSGSRGDKHGQEWVRMRAEEMAGRARKMGTRTARVEVPDAPWEPRPLRLRLTAAERRGAWVLALDGVAARRGAWSLGPPSASLRSSPAGASP